MRAELCYCVDTITDRHFKETRRFQRAAKFSDTVPRDLPDVRPQRTSFLHLSIDDIPDFDHSGSRACWYDYKELCTLMSRFPCFLTPDCDPDLSFDPYMVTPLKGRLKHFDKDDRSLLYRCASQFLTNFPDSYFIARRKYDYGSDSDSD